jgi:hypothetical protein
MVRLRKHINGDNTVDRIPPGSHHSEVAGKRCRIAGHIDYLFGITPADKIDHLV